MKPTTLLLLLFALLKVTVYAQDKKLTISGFGEVRANTNFGKYPNQEMHDLFEDYGGRGTVYSEAGSVLNFAPFNLNFIGQLSDKLTFTGEMNNEVDEGELEVRLYRANLKYGFSEKFNLTTGLFMTPIGYLNRNQRIYSYLNYSVLPRDMVSEENRYIPVFTSGVMIDGTFSNATSSLKYFLSFGENRSFAPERSAFTAFLYLTEEEYRGLSSKPGFAGGLHVNLFTGDTESTLGLSGWYNPEVVTVLNDVLGGDVEYGRNRPQPTIATAREVGFAPFLRIDNNKWQFFAEYHTNVFTDRLKNTYREKYYYSALTTEFLLKRELAGKNFYPYVRYDYRKVTNNHFYYGLYDEGTTLHRSYVPDFSELMVGACWEPFTNNRIKFEYGRIFNGTAPSDRVTLSTSFGF
jgi:hypothetical protein